MRSGVRWTIGTVLRACRVLRCDNSYYVAGFRMNGSSPSTPRRTGQSTRRPLEGQPKAGGAEASLQLALNVALGQGLPPPEITAEVATFAQKLCDVSGALVRQHLEQILLAPRVQDALQWLHDAGLLAVTLPEIDATVGWAQEVDRHHKDVWAHTKQVVDQSEVEAGVRWAALLHDIGKVPTRELTPDGKVTFHGHAEVGAKMFDKVARRLQFPKPLRSRVRWLILHHQRTSQYDASWSDSAVRRFDRQMGEHVEDLLRLSQADITSARQSRREAARRNIEELRGRISALRQQDSVRPPLPSGLGNAIMQHFRLEPGRHIGEIKRRLEQAVEREELEPHRDETYYVDYLRRMDLVPPSGSESDLA